MNPTDNEALRHAVLEILAPRYPATKTPEQIARVLTKDFKEIQFTKGDLDAALAFLQEKKFARVDFDGMGPTQYWCATSEGVLYFERNLK